jgi:hypothetical protein
MKKNNEFKKLLLVTFCAVIVIFLGMIFYHLVEGFSWVDAFYFCVTTLATVGYGDINPVTDIGKIFTSFYIFLGLGFILAFANIFTDKIISSREGFFSKLFHRD